MALQSKIYNRKPLPSDVLVGDPLPELAAEKVVIKSNGSTARDVNAGTVIAKFTSGGDAGKALELTPAAEDGTETAYGVVIESATVPATGDLELIIRRSHVLVRSDGLIWPAGISGANKTAALAALAAKFIHAV